MRFLIQSILILFFCSQASSAITPEHKTKIRNIVERFYEFKTFSLSAKGLRSRHPGCDDQDQTSCVDTVCKKLGPFDCDSTEELKEIGAICRGNFGGTCVDEVCKKIGPFDCDSAAEIKPIGRACVGNHDMSCFEATCKRLGPFDCDDTEEVVEVLNICAGN
ncbi:MAG: hypothetical protein AB7O96_07005 [Pseudobdellovibrionaceae bacterium]